VAARPPRPALAGRRPLKRRRSPWTWVTLAAVGVALLTIVVVAVTRSGGAGSSSAPVAEGALLPRSNRAIAPGVLQSIHQVSATPRVENGKPIVFFMGGQFCPFCAADRWAFVKATSRFGTWGNLRPLSSQRGQTATTACRPTTWVDASYQSDLLSMHHKEVADTDGNQLQSLEGVEQDFVNQYDPSGGFPFMVVSGSPGQFTVGLAYSPALIQGQSFDALRAAVDSDADTPAVKAIDDEADAITALLCRTTGGKPGNVCSVPSILALTNQLS